MHNYTYFGENLFKLFPTSNVHNAKGTNWEKEHHNNSTVFKRSPTLVRLWLLLIALNGLYYEHDAKKDKILGKLLPQHSAFQTMFL